MSRVYTVVLPREDRPVFPDRCPFTGRKHPQATVRLIFRDVVGRRTPWSGWFSLHVPCSPEHRLRVQSQCVWCSFRKFVVALGTLIFASVFLFASFQEVARAWLSCGFMALCVGAVVAWEHFVPPAFTTSVRADIVSYEFRDREYAIEFAALNGAVPATAASKPTAA